MDKNINVRNCFTEFLFFSSNFKVGKSSLLVLSYKNVLQTFTIFNAKRFQPKKISPKCIYVLCCMIWDQTLKNSVQMVGQNAILIRYNALQWLSQERKLTVNVSQDQYKTPLC